MKIQYSAYLPNLSGKKTQNFNSQQKNIKQCAQVQNPVYSVRFADIKGILSFKARLEAPYFLNLKDTWGDPQNADGQKMYYAYEKIEKAANDHIYAYAQDNKPPIKRGDSIWSVTAEFRPIQAGGLGVVPSDIKVNFEKHGIKMPVFIPLYHDGNKAIVFDSKDGNKYFMFKESTYTLEKVAQYKTNALLKGKDTTETIEIFKGTPFKGAPIYFVSNMDYTFSSIYGDTIDFDKNEVKAMEKERFAFFTKAVHEFAAAKLDPERAKNFSYINKELFEEVPKPDGFLLNDWHASALAPLLRYKSVMQNLYGDLSFEAAEKLRNSRIVTIAHHVGYQGEVWEEGLAEDILNTLFDQYAMKIVQKGRMNIEGIEDLESPFLFGYANSHSNKHLNLLNMASSLSDYVVPVSKNFANELINNSAEVGTRWMYKQLNIRHGNGTLKGIINGNDKYLLVPNGELINVALQRIRKVPDCVKFSEYNVNDSRLHKKRLNNKEQFMKNLLPAIMEDKSNEFVYADGNSTQYEDTVKLIKDTDFSNTPVYTYVGRMAEQKGLETISGSIIGMYDAILNSPDKDNKPLPFFVIGGPDEEGGRYWAEMKSLKNQLFERFGADIANRVIVHCSFINSFIYMLGSDFLMAPSNFEPCGLIQTEAQAKGTIPVTSHVGGFLDTIYDPLREKTASLEKFHKGQTGYVSEELGWDKSNDRKVKCYKETLMRTYDDFTTKRNKIKTIVKNAMKLDPSWDRGDGTGSIWEYFKLFGYNPKIHTLQGDEGNSKE